MNGTSAGSGAVNGSTVTWDGLNPFWNVLSDGTGATSAWIPGDTAVFAAGTDATGTYTVNVSGTQVISGLAFEEGTFTLSGGTLDIGSAVGGTADINVASGLTSTVGSVITGNPSGTTVLTKTGLGTLVLSSAGNTFGAAGKTFAIQQGTVSFSADAQLGTGNSLALGTATDVASLLYTGGTATISRAMALGSVTASTTGNTITVQNAASILTWSGVISGGPANAAGNTALTINGPGTLVLSGANTFTGDIIVDGAKVQFNALSGFGLTNASGSTNKTTFLRNGATIIINGSLNPTGGGADDKRISIGTGGATIQVNPTFTYTLDDANQFSGTGDVTKTGTGIMVLGNTYAGYTGSNFFLNAGTLRLQAVVGALGTTTKALITMAGGTSLDLRLNSGGAFNNAVKLTGDAIITTGRTSAASTNINITMGTLEIGSNTLTVSNGVNNGTGFTANLVFGATTLTGNATFNVNNNNGAGGIGSLTLGALNDGGAARNITKSGPGTLILTSTATSFVSGGVMNVLDGALSLNATDTLGGSGTLINLGDTSGTASTALRMATANTTTSSAIIVRAGSTGSATIEGTNAAGTVTYSGNVTLNKDVIINSTAGGNVAFSGVIDDGAGTFNVVVGGTGTTIFSGANTYNGTTSITGGRLQITSDANLGAAPGVATPAHLVINGATLAAAETFVLNANRGIALGPNAGSGSGTVEVFAGKTLTYNGVMANNGAGTGALIKTGNGILKLGGANTYTGATTVNTGTLQLDFNTAGAPASDIINGTSALVVGGGRLLMSGKNAAASVQTFNGLTVNSGASTIQVVEGVGAGSSATLNLGSSYVNNGGAVNFILPTAGSGSINMAATALDPTTGLLRGASVNGTSFATINGSNQIVAFNAFVNKNDLTTWVAGDHITNTAAFTNSLTADVDISTLRFNFAGVANANLGAGRTLTVLGGIQVTSNVGANASTISTGSIRGSAGGLLYVLQNNTAGDLTISATVVDNTSATAFVKAGQGRVILSGANTYTGVTTVAEGALRVTNAAGLGTGAAGTNVSIGAALELVGVTITSEAISLNGDGIAAGGALRNISGTSVLNTAVTLLGASRINSDSGTLTIDVASGNAINAVNQDLTIGGAGTVSIGDAINLGVATLTKDGTGTLVTSNDAALGGSSVVLNLNGGKLTAFGTRNYTNAQVNINANMTFGDTAATQTGAQTFTTAAVNLGGAVRTLTTDEEIIFGGVVSNGGITKTGDDFIQFNNANNTFNGGYIMNQGDTRLGASGNVLGTGLVTFNATNARIRSNDTTARSFNNNVSVLATAIFGATTTGSLTVGVLGSTTVDFGAGSRTLTIEANTTFNSAVVNGTGLTKGGAGTLTFLGTNTQTGNIQINTGNITVMGTQGKLSGAVTGAGSMTIVGDNNGNDESLTIGDVSDAVSGTVDRVADEAGIRINGSVPVTFNGPSASITEAFLNLDFAAGVGVVNLNPDAGGQIQLNIANLQRSNGNGTGVIRAAGLGQAVGTAGSSRIIFTNAPTTAGLGGTGSASSIVPFLIGGTSLTAAPDTFLTYDSVTGLKMLTNADYEASITSNRNRNISLGASESVTSDIAINALRMTSGGAVTVGSGVDLSVRSGAVLFTSGGTISGTGTLSLGEGLVNGTGVGRQAIIHVSGDTTALEATISANIHTSGGLAFGDAGNTGHTLVLSGDNNIVGGITVNGGTLRAGSNGAFNDEYYNDLALRAGNSAMGGALSTALQTWGNNVAVVFGGNDRLQGSTRIQNGLAATTSTFTILATATSDGNDGFLEDGAGILNLVKRGVRVQLEGNNTYTGTTEILSGELRVASSAGRLSGTSSITIRGGGILYTYNQNDQTANRISDTANIIMHGGSYQFDQNQSAFNLAEVVGNLSVLNGDNSLITDFSATAQTSSITFTSFAISSGATMNFTTFGTAPVSGLEPGIGETNDNQVFFTTDPTLTAGGLIGGNVYHTKNLNAAASQDIVNFAGYDLDTDGAGADTEGGVIAFAGYNTGLDSTWTATTVANPGADLALSASRTIEAIRLGGGIDINIGAGQTLNLTTGGLIHNGASATISNGTLTAGGNAAGDLYIRVEDNLTTAVLTISSVIADNGGGSVSLTKSGTDELTLTGANTYTGRTTISGGAVNITSDANLGAAPAVATAGHLRLYGGILNQSATTGTVTINGNRGLELGGASNTISTAGTSNLVYNASSITSNGDASLTLVGNVDMAMTGNTNIGGNFVIQGAGQQVSLGGTSNFIGGSLQVGVAPGTGSFTYNVAGGVLTVGANSPNLANLDVGSRVVSTTGAIGIGTMNLTGSANFIATVDRVRIGVMVIDPTTDVGAQGSLTLSTNSTITAGTEVLISDSAFDGLTGLGSSMTFGSGTSNLTTKLLTVGGRKGDGTLSVVSGGVLNLGGFGERTLDVYVARNTINTAVSSIGNFNFTSGTLNASIDELIIADKSGGNNSGAKGIFTLGTASHNVAINSMVIARQVGGAANIAAIADGTYNQAGGAVSVLGDVTLASHDGGNGTVLGTMNLTGGTLTVGGNISKAGTTRSSAVLNITGGTLDLQDQANGDTTKGSFTGSRLVFRSGSIVDADSFTLDGVSVSTGTGFSVEDDALLVQDVTMDFNVLLTLAQDGLGGIRYDSVGNGTGAVLNGNLDLGTVSRDFNIDDSTNAAADMRVNGRITNTGSLNKQGNGTLVLSNANNNYQGTTTVNEGVLQVGVNGVGTTGTGFTFVAFDATLAGTGTVTGASATHIIAGTLSPGDLGGSGVGNLKFEGNLTFQSAATLTLQLGSPSAPGTTYDRITGTSAGDILILDGTINAAEDDDSFFGGYVASGGDTWFLLMDWTTINLASFNVGTNMRSGADGAAEGDLDLPTLGANQFWDVSDFATNGTIRVFVVPEPGRAFLLLLGISSLIMRRRRFKKC